MPQTFFILLAGGIMLAAAISSPRQVTLTWLRLGGLIALSVLGVGIYFRLRPDAEPAGSVLMLRVQTGLIVATAVAVLGQLAFVQVAWGTTQRVFACAAVACAVLAGANLLHVLMEAQGTAVRLRPKALSIGLQALACAGIAALPGLSLMDMLLGHAYLTASRMSIDPFRRLNISLGVAMTVRAASSVPLVLLLQHWQPMEMLWGMQGLLILTRWLVGLAVPGLFVYMAHDCIKRRSTQSATGILYVAVVLILIGEIMALHLVRSTGLPF
jgi:hypothetical protein